MRHHILTVLLLTACTSTYHPVTREWTDRAAIAALVPPATSSGPTGATPAHREAWELRLGYTGAETATALSHYHPGDVPGVAVAAPGWSYSPNPARLVTVTPWHGQAWPRDAWPMDSATSPR